MSLPTQSHLMSKAGKVGEVNYNWNKFEKKDHTRWWMIALHWKQLSWGWAKPWIDWGIWDKWWWYNISRLFGECLKQCTYQGWAIALIDDKTHICIMYVSYVSYMYISYTYQGWAKRCLSSSSLLPLPLLQFPGNIHAYDYDQDIDDADYHGAKDLKMCSETFLKLLIRTIR